MMTIQDYKNEVILKIENAILRSEINGVNSEIDKIFFEIQETIRISKLDHWIVLDFWLDIYDEVLRLKNNRSYLNESQHLHESQDVTKFYNLVNHILKKIAEAKSNLAGNTGVKK